MVRVVNPESSQRALIRGKSSEVLDLQFAHIKSQILLASIEINALHVHRIEEINGTILCTLQLKIEDPIVNYVPKYDKVNWCPFVPDSETENDDHAGKLLVWTRDTSCQCINVSTVIESHGVSDFQHFIVIFFFLNSKILYMNFAYSLENIGLQTSKMEH